MASFFDRKRSGMRAFVHSAVSDRFFSDFPAVGRGIPEIQFQRYAGGNGGLYAH